jgi:amino acid adenylation domain-containing protein
MNIIAGFIAQRRLQPDHIALCESDRRLTYQAFHESWQGLASNLAGLNCTDACIAIAIDRGIDATCAIFAILAAGACYLPLDLKNPSERLNFIIDDAGAKYVLGLGDCPNWLKAKDKWLAVDQLTPGVTALPAIEDDPERLGAILYTSGSTGMPKGVALSHRALLSFADWARLEFGLDTETRIASLAPFYFDLSIFDLFSSLHAGASVHFMPPALTLAPAKLTEWLHAESISHWYSVPSLLSFWALKGNLAALTLPALKILLFAGEVFPTSQLIRLQTHLPDTRLFNLYGPTETNVCCYWPVEKSRLNPDNPIPIGKSAAGARLRIDTDSFELQVLSANNFSGYWQRGQLDQTPLRQGWYGTGDKVSVNAEGEYCYHGRLDRMLKCAGFRIEPAEIETVLANLPEVFQSAVAGIEDAAGGKRPAAVLALNDRQALPAVIKAAKAKLPAYMHPAKYVVVDALPLTGNGKIDYTAIAMLLNAE